MKKKPRNPVARSPLMKKGGRHDKPKSAERMKGKRALRSEVSQSNADPANKKP